MMYVCTEGGTHYGKASRGSGNYAFDEAKEIAQLKRELRDAQDTLDLLKKQSTFWEGD